MRATAKAVQSKEHTLRNREAAYESISYDGMFPLSMNRNCGDPAVNEKRSIITFVNVHVQSGSAETAAKLQFCKVYLVDCAVLRVTYSTSLQSIRCGQFRGAFESVSQCNQLFDFLRKCRHTKDQLNLDFLVIVKTSHPLLYLISIANYNNNRCM